MKNNKKLFSAIMVICGICGLTSCINDQQTLDEKPKQLNITVLLDLSDRISPTVHSAVPSHAERDTAIIMEIVDLFKQDMNRLGGYNAMGKLRVEMEPWPAIANINNIQKELDVDCSEMNTKEKKELYDNIEATFSHALAEIYDETIMSSRWAGSDIWRFFKNKVDMYIEKDTCYRNILIILTDGYIYHENTRAQDGNSVQCLTKSTIGKYRTTNDPIKEIQSSGFGLMIPRDDLQNLEVLVLEVTPEDGQNNDDDILKYCIGEWLKGMGVSKEKYAIYTTDLPSNTAKRIRHFIQ